MKTKISRIGKKSLSVVIALMMIVSTMLVGMVSASAASDTFVANTTIYIDIGATWYDSVTDTNVNATIYANYCYSDATGDTSKPVFTEKLTQVSNSIYSGTIPNNSSIRCVKVDRRNSDGTTTWNSFNALASSRSDDGNNLATFEQSGKDWSIGSVAWSNYSGGSGETTATYYYSYYDKSNGKNKFVQMNKDKKNEGSYIIHVSTSDSRYAPLTNDNKFKISNAQSTVKEDADRILADSSKCVNWSEGFSTGRVSTSVSLTDVLTFSVESEWHDLIIGNIGSNTDFYIQYTPSGTSGLDGNIKVWSVTDYEGTTEPTTAPTEPTTTEPVETTVPPTTAPVTTSGDFNIVDKTDANGSLSFTTEGKDNGTASADDLVTVTATPDKYFECTTIVVTYKDSKKVSHNIDAPKTASNKFTFTVPAGLTKADIKDQEISVTGTFVLTSTGKADYIKAQGDGLWIDVAPNENDTTATLIKWNNYKGSSHTNRGSYIFYLPKNVNLSDVKIYNGFEGDVTIQGVTISSNSCNASTLSLNAGTTYTPSGKTTSSFKIMQGSTDAMFFTTSTSLPTAISSIASGDTVSTDDDAKKYKEKINYSGGSCKTMSNDTATASFSNALGLSSIKGRGNSSWKASAQVFGKYAFNMKLSSKTSLLGMDSAKSWCLLANNADESMMRNALTYQLAKEIGLPDSPEFRFVDIYDNGEYMGAYLVTEKVDVGKSKLVKGESFEDLNEDAVKAQGGTEIDETLSNDATYSFTDSQDNTYSNLSMRYATVGNNTGSSPFEYNTTGKYLLEFEISERVNDEPSYFVSPHGQNVVVKNPEFATKEQVTYIAQKFAEMEDIAFTTGATKAQLSTVMDVESFAKMYLIQEFSSNLDSASTSYYITFDCAKTNPVFVANPVWDYDWAYGQYDNSVGKKVDVNGTQLDTKGTNSWVAKNKAMDDSKNKDKGRSLQSQLAGTNNDFKSVIRKVWEETNGFYDKIKQYYSSDGQITSWKNKISSSVNMNETRWGFIKDNLILSWGSVDTGDTFDGEKSTVTALNTWVTNRATWLNTELRKEPEYKAYTPDAPTIKLYAADGKTETSAVEQGTGFIIKVTSTVENNVVYRFFTSEGTQVDSDQSDGILEFATDDLTVGETYTYKVQAVYNGNASDYSNTVSVTIDDKAGNKQVTIYFKSASASVYVPSLSVDGGSSAVMTREAKTAESNGTYFGSTYSGSLKFYWFYTKMTLDTSVDHTLKFTTKDNRVNASTSYKFVASEGNKYYFAVDNLMGDTNLVDLTGEKEYIRNYHISATHMVYSAISDSNIGFTWTKDAEGNYEEYAMGTYLDSNGSTASLADLTSSSLLTIPSALTPNAMLEASSAPTFFTIKSATLAQRISAEAEEVSTLQYQLLDVNLDGKVDVKDSTMMQKALAGL